MSETEAGQKMIPFVFEGEKLVRVIERDSAPWFVSRDVCSILGIKNTAQAMESLDEDEKGICSTYTLGGPQELLILSEGGLYTLILRSRDATKSGTVAHRFRRWVTGEVLPSIRKTGSYTATQSPVELPPVDATSFPNWPLEQIRARTAVANAYWKLYGARSAQWIMPQLGFPTPPAAMIDVGRQTDLFETMPPGLTD
jgi:prophage antirepressor-like protein